MAKQRRTRPGVPKRSHNRHLPGAWQARHEAGITQAQLAERAGLSRPYVSQVEWQDVKASPDTAKRIADALGVSTKALYQEEPDEQADSQEDAVLDFAPEGFNPLFGWSPEALAEYEQQQRVVYERCLADDSPETGMHRGALAAALAARSATEGDFERVREAIMEAMKIAEGAKVGEARA